MAETTLLSLRPTRLIALHYYVITIILWFVSALAFLDPGSWIPDWRLFEFRLQSYAGALLGFLGLLTLLRAELKRMSVRYLVTDTRVIRRDGILRRKTQEMPFNKLERVELDQSLLQRILKVGDVVLDTGEDTIVLGSLGHVHLIRDELSKVLATYSRR